LSFVLAAIAGCFGPTSPSDDRFLRGPSPPPPPPIPPATVNGVVTDSLRHIAVSGALIEWGSPASFCGENSDSVVTDNNGAYTMSVPRGGVIMCATKDGYKGYEQPVSVDSSEATVNFALTPLKVERNQARR
jgi:hypothetical protein